jgi:c-di-GMP-binding flagellar brake protein YcgR
MFFKHRRKFKRIGAHHLVKFKSLSGKDEPIISFARNLSAGGVLLYAKKSGVLGDVLEVTINFPGADKPISVKGKVLRSKELKKIGGYEIAVQFINISKEEFELMQKRIDRSIEQAKKGKKKNK